jgi:hypothetical protein
MTVFFTVTSMRIKNTPVLHCIQISYGTHPASLAPGYSNHSIKLIKHPYLVPRFRMCGALPPLTNLFTKQYLITGTFALFTDTVIKYQRWLTKLFAVL